MKKSIHSTLIGDPGAGRRIAFLHGLFGRGKNFTTLAKGLEPEAQSLLIDAPNHGESAWTTSFDYIAAADLIADHLRQNFAKNGPVDIVGHSMGGKNAMVLALRHPELVRKLVIVDISPTAATDSRAQFQHLLGSLMQINLADFTRRQDVSKALTQRIPEAHLRGFLLQNLKVTGQTLQWEPNLELLYSELETIMGFPNMAGHVYEGPVLWVAGSESNYITDADEPAMRALFPKTRRLTIKGAGHWVHSEKPAETLAALRAFLIE